MSNRDLGNMRKSYGLTQLRRSELHADPMLQFKTWFDAARNSQVHEPNAMALATVDHAQQPSCRIVLLKAIDHGFIFYTNYSSRKGKQLLESSHAAATFWWDKLERQVRIEGVVEKLEAQLSDAYFSSRPVGSQISALASPQSQPVERYQDLLELKEAVDQDHLVRPDHWGGYRIIPKRIEFWQGRENRLHDRFVYKVDDSELSWSLIRLAP